MSHFEAARKNMIDGQIHTAGVILPEVLNAFETIAREEYVPAPHKGIAYHDEDLRVGEGRYLLEPIVHSKMVQALEPKASDVVLDIGGGTGYSAAILAMIVSTVVAVEASEDLLGFAQNVWEAQGLQNIVGFQGPLQHGYAASAPYDLIFIHGAVSQVPKEILNQLAPDGRLVAVVKREANAMGDVMVYQSLGENRFSSYSVFQAGSHMLPGFEGSASFSF